MATDTARSRILLFGGTSKGWCPLRPPTNYTDGWAWDGGKTTWTKRAWISSNNTPDYRGYPVLAFDGGRNKLSLFGAALSDMPFMSDPSAFRE